MKLSLGERLAIQRMANGHNVDWETISKQIGCDVNDAKDVMGRHYSPKFKRLMQKPKRSKIPRMNGEWGRRAAGFSADDHQRVKASPEQIADRDRRAELDSPGFGDPKPGYSMLDRRQK